MCGWWEGRGVVLLFVMDSISILPKKEEISTKQSAIFRWGQVANSSLGDKRRRRKGVVISLLQALSMSWWHGGVVTGEVGKFSCECFQEIFFRRKIS